jgi:hypothetical protein
MISASFASPMITRASPRPLRGEGSRIKISDQPDDLPERYAPGRAFPSALIASLRHRAAGRERRQPASRAGQRHQRRRVGIADGRQTAAPPAIPSGCR